MRVGVGKVTHTRDVLMLGVCCKAGIACVSRWSSCMSCHVQLLSPGPPLGLPGEHPFCYRRVLASSPCSGHERTAHSMECGPSYLYVARLQHQLAGPSTWDSHPYLRLAQPCPQSGRHHQLVHSRAQHGGVSLKGRSCLHSGGVIEGLRHLRRRFTFAERKKRIDSDT